MLQALRGDIVGANSSVSSLVACSSRCSASHQLQVHSYSELIPVDSDWPVGRHHFSNDTFKPKASQRSILEINTCAGVKQHAEWVTFTPETWIRQAPA